MIVRSICFLALAIVCVGGCTDGPTGNRIPPRPKTALEKANDFELLSLDPIEPKEEPADGFHGWKVLGRIAIKDADSRKKLVQALKKGVDENNNVVAGCFNPRHGIRTTHDGVVIDFVICFECFSVLVYTAGKSDGWFLTTGTPHPVFDQVLHDAGVPLAPSAKKRGANTSATSTSSGDD